MLGDDKVMGVNYRLLPEKLIEGLAREVTYGPKAKK